MHSLLYSAIQLNLALLWLAWDSAVEDGHSCERNHCYHILRAGSFDFVFDLRVKFNIGIDYLDAEYRRSFNVSDLDPFRIIDLS